MNPLRDALIALVHGPLKPAEYQPGPGSWVERALIAAATLVVGAGVVLSMRWLEPYPGWWPLNVVHRVPVLVLMGVVVSAVVAAGPGRWWFALPICVLGAGAISHGVRGPLSGEAWPWLAVSVDAIMIGVPAFLVQYLVNRVADGDRSLRVRPLPLLALALALMPIPALIFVSGQSVNARQFGAVVAVLAASAIALAVLGNSAGRLVLRGVGVLVVLAVGVWILIVATLANHLLTPTPAILLVAAGVGAGLAGLLLPRLSRWWMPAVLALALVGGPVAAAAAVQYLGIERDDAGAADYGY